MANFTTNPSFEASRQRVIDGIKANGKKATAAEFGQQEVRDLANTGFAVGDIFKVDASEKYIRTVRGNKAYLLVVAMKDGSARELYCSQMSRTVIPYTPSEDNLSAPKRNDDATEIDNGIAKGTAVDLWKKHGNCQKAAEALDGKYVKVTDRRVVHTYIPNQKQERDQVVYDFDLVDEEEANA